MLMRLRRLEGGVVLCLEREGAPAVVQRSGHGGFFGPHDLMHYAVETTLGINRGFLGLMSEGWELSAFTDRADPRFAALPWEALYTERLVDLLLRAIADGGWRDAELRGLWFADVWGEAEALYVDAPAGVARLTMEMAVGVCEVFDGLMERWTQTPTGSDLTLEF